MTVTASTGQSETTTQPQITISVEWLLIGALAAFIFITRLAAIDTPTMTQSELPDALAAWRSVAPNAAGAESIPTSTVQFWVQRFSFVTLGGTEFASRWLTAFGGVLLALTPFLFRETIGRDRAFIFALTLAFSPVMLAASRFSSPVIWSLLFAALILWGVTRFWTTGKAGYATFTTVTFAALIFLSEPGGLLLALILAGSGAVALALGTLDAPVNDDLPGDAYLNSVRERFATWPLSSSLGIALLFTFCIATGFLLYANGLAIVGETLRGFVEGWTQRPTGAPIFYPLTTAFFYETFLFVLAGAAVIVLTAVRRIAFVDRFLMAWVMFAIVAALIYPGAVAAHALWLTVPLAGLTSALVIECFRRVRSHDDWWPLPDENEQNTSRWLVAAIALAILLMMAAHFQTAMRGFWVIPGGSIDAFATLMNEPGFNAHAIGVIGFLVSLLFIIIGYFLASSLIGSIIPAQGLALGVFAFALLTSFGSGWNLVGTRANDPAEVWFINGTSSEVDLLRDTLLELSFRETQGFPELPVVVVMPSDSAVAWAVRDFRHAQFVASLDDARAAQIIIAPSYDLLEGIDLPARPELELGATYVGQDFQIRRTWRSSWLEGFQALAWWSSRLDSGAVRAEQNQQTLEKAVVWVRQDIYDGNPFTGEFD